MAKVWVAHKTWVDHFAKHLNAKQNFSAVVRAQAGDNNDATKRLSGTYTDFLAVFTVDYADQPPDELDKVINEISDLTDQNCLIMWLAKYDADDYRDTKLFKKYQKWHTLSGTGKDGARFKELDEPGGRDDLADAANTIYKHKTCALPSPVCPKYQESSPNGQNQNNPSLLTKLFGKFRKQP